MTEPFVFSEEPDPSSVEFERAPPTGFFQGIGLSAAQTFNSGPFNDLLFHTEKFILNAENPGKKLTSEEYEKSPFKTPGKSFPTGVSENVAKFTFQRFQEQQLRAEKLSKMNKGFLSGLGRFVGDSIGFVADIGNLATMVAAKNVIGVRAPALLARAGEFGNLQLRSTQVGIGLAEGAAVTAPAGVAAFDFESQLQDDPNPAIIMSTIGYGAAFGGVIRGAAGFHKAITSEADRLAKQTSINQLFTGKDVSIDSIVKNGQYQEMLRTKTNNFTDEEMDIFQSRLKTRIDQIEKELANKKDLSGSKHGLSLLNNIREVLDIPAEERTAAQSNLLIDAPRSLSFKRAIAAIKDVSRGELDREAIESLVKDDEFKNTKEEVDLENQIREANDPTTRFDLEDAVDESDIEGKINSINQKIKESGITEDKIKKNIEKKRRIGRAKPKDKLKAKRQRKELREIKQQENKLSNVFKLKEKNLTTKDILKRLDALKERNKKLSRLTDRLKELEGVKDTENIIEFEKLRMKLADFKRVESNNELISEIINTARAVQKEELIAETDKIHSYKGDSTYDPDADRRFDGEVQREENADAKKAQVEEIKKANKLLEDDKENLERVRKERSNFSVFSKALNDAIECAKAAIV